MKNGMEQNVGVTAFDLADSQNPNPHAPIYYGNQHVPRPTNSAAKIVNAEEVMRHVREGK